MADFANDVRAAVAYLRTRPEIDGARIGLVGHSEGALVAPMVASTDTMVRAVVLMGPSASTGRALVLEQNRYLVDSVIRATGRARDSLLDLARRGADSVANQRAWARFFYDYDPTITARRVSAPVLILEGGTDRQVPAGDASRLASAFRAGGNTRVETRTFPETNHLFVADANGAFRDANGALRYASLSSLRVRREVLGAVADWLTAQLK
jgi:uncharacterized protein